MSVDELLTIAISLNTSVIDLLTPADGSSLLVAESVEPLDPRWLELWLQGETPWPSPRLGTESATQDVVEFLQGAAEHRRAKLRMETRPEIAVIDQLRAYVSETIEAMEDPQGYGRRTPFTPKNMANVLQMALKDVDNYITLLASHIEKNADGG
ncbi:hypothetical protein A5661_26385 [Mycobacterium asiaticum]|nr:hypothetical protein A5661_26385 [Mycobacterium asiaticum]